MILEALEWCATPASWRARSQGFLAAQIAIRHRRQRCAGHWRPHLEESRRFIEEQVAADTGGPREHVLVLGGGHLNDVDPEFLDRTFRRITLVDVVHPIEVQLRCLLSSGRWSCVSADLAAPDPRILTLVQNASWVFSTCLLSQLPLGHPPESAPAILGRHLELLRSARRAVLITDAARRFSPTEDWSVLWKGGALPDASETWVWRLAPPEEHGDPGRGCEERRVEACVLGTGLP